MRLWDLRAGLPLASSRLLRGTVRALSMDENMLVSTLLSNQAYKCRWKHPALAAIYLRSSHLQPHGKNTRLHTWRAEAAVHLETLATQAAPCQTASNEL